MSKVVHDLEGSYKRHGNLLQNLTYPGNGLIVSQRADRAHMKALNFILHVDPQGNRTYISSLYQTDDPGIWVFEYSGSWFTLQESGADTYSLIRWNDV